MRAQGGRWTATLAPKSNGCGACKPYERDPPQDPNPTRSGNYQRSLGWILFRGHGKDNVLGVHKTLPAKIYVVNLHILQVPMGVKSNVVYR